MAQVLLLCLSNQSLVVTCPAWGWSQAAVLHHRRVHHELQWLLQQAESTRIYQLECPRLWFWVVWKCLLPSKVGLNFHPQYFHIAVKGGLYNDVAGCSASMHCLHERSPLQSHISSGEEQLLWEVFFVLFLTGSHRLLQKIFNYILLEISAPLVHRCECTYGTSGTTWCTGHAIKVIFGLLPENTANLKISIMYWEVLRVKLSITSLKSQDWALYLEFFSSDFYLLGAE